MSSEDDERPSTSTPREGYGGGSPYFSSEESSYASSPSTPGANTPRKPSWIADSGSDAETSALNVAAIEAEEASGDNLGVKGLDPGPLKKEANKVIYISHFPICISLSCSFPQLIFPF